LNNTQQTDGQQNNGGAAAPVGGAPIAPVAGDTVANVADDVDWSSLENLVGGRCMGGNQTLEELLGNNTNPIPQDYLSAVTGSGVDFQSQQNFNASKGLFDWSVPELKQWLTNYLDYHNAVAGLVGPNFVSSQNATEEAFNFTRINQVYNANDFWLPAWDNSTLANVIQSVEPQGIAYETFAYHNLFFGPFGILANRPADALNETATQV